MFDVCFLDGEEVLAYTNQNRNYQKKNNFFSQRLRRRARNVQQRYKRQFDGSTGDDYN